VARAAALGTGVGAVILSVSAATVHTTERAAVTAALRITAVQAGKLISAREVPALRVWAAKVIIRTYDMNLKFSECVAVAVEAAVGMAAAGAPATTLAHRRHRSVLIGVKPLMREVEAGRAMRNPVRVTWTCIGTRLATRTYTTVSSTSSLTRSVFLTRRDGTTYSLSGI
jgi:hypothetical protein